MESNHVFPEKGGEILKNDKIMELIIDEVEKFKAEKPNGHIFHSLKIIYCTPRSLSCAQIGRALDECIEFKRKWPKWIAGMGNATLAAKSLNEIATLTYIQGSTLSERNSWAIL
jgi:hypothetical protein